MRVIYDKVRNAQNVIVEMTQRAELEGKLAELDRQVQAIVEEGAIRFVPAGGWNAMDEELRAKWGPTIIAAESASILADEAARNAGGGSQIILGAVEDLRKGRDTMGVVRNGVGRWIGPGGILTPTKISPGTSSLFAWARTPRG